MGLIEWTAVLGNVGEFVGAIAVVVTLIYLAVQVRHSRQSLDANTNALEENRRLSIANAYQARTALTGEHLLRMRDSPYAERLSRLSLAHVPDTEFESKEEEVRFRSHIRFLMNYYDNVHFQYQQGFVTDEFYARGFVDQIRLFAPSWRALGIRELRDSFETEVDRVLSDDDSA